MTERYLGYALVSMVAYSLVAPLLKVAMASYPTTPAVFVSNFVLLVIVGGLVYYREQPVRPHLGGRSAALIVLSGVLLTVGLLTYYRALAHGPVSVVVPIYGLFIVVSAVLGIVLFDESLTPRKLAGIGFSVLAIALISM